MKTKFSSIALTGFAVAALTLTVACSKKNNKPDGAPGAAPDTSLTPTKGNPAAPQANQASKTVLEGVWVTPCVPTNAFKDPSIYKTTQQVVLVLGDVMETYTVFSDQDNCSIAEEAGVAFSDDQTYKFDITKSNPSGNSEITYHMKGGDVMDIFSIKGSKLVFGDWYSVDDSGRPTELDNSVVYTKK